MSPSEFDLRAALRDGEGDGVDVDRVLALGSARRAERRSRILNTAAAVVVVGALGTGGVLLARGGGESAGNSSAAGGANATTSSTSADKVAAAPQRSQAAAGNSDAPRAAASAPASCPTDFPRTLLPTGPATKGPLFSRPVSSVVVCSYGSPRAVHAPVRLLLVGTQAADLVGRLENASRTLRPLPCPTVTEAQRTSLAIIGITADGQALPVVTTTVDGAACNLQATNGIAVRYDWKPPPELLQEFAELGANPSGPATLTSPSSGIRATPVR